jgi:threonine dehydratase
MLTFELIKQAAARIAGRVHRTPVMTSRSFNEVAGREVFFKCENLQRAGAFKARGATNKILSLTDEEKARGVIAVSSGNHAQPWPSPRAKPACAQSFVFLMMRRK